MNPTQAPFPMSQPALKLTRRSVARGSSDGSTTPFAGESTSDIAVELATLQEREANLRAYEQRLRAWQDELDARAAQPASTPTAAPFLRTANQTSAEGLTDAALQAAWEKFHRARALLESEQNQMRDDRMALRDAQAQLREREATLDAREAALTERERRVAEVADSAVTAVEPAPETTKPKSALARLTQAPWGMFKSGS